MFCKTTTFKCVVFPGNNKSFIYMICKYCKIIVVIGLVSFLIWHLVLHITKAVVDRKYGDSSLGV